MVRWLLAIALLGVASSSSSQAWQCRGYGLRQTLSGVLTRENIHLPHRFENGGMGHVWITFHFLTVSEPFCVQAGAGDANKFNVPVEDVKRIQLVFLGEAFERYGKAPEGTVTVIGKLRGAYRIDIYEQTPVVIEVEEIRR